MTETARTPIGRIEAFDLDPVRPHDRSHHELSDPIATLDFEVDRAEVHQDHLNLSAIVGVDRTGRVGDQYAMPKRQSTAWANLRLETRGKRDAPTCGNQPSFSWGNPNRLCHGRTQIEPCRCLG